MKISIKPTIKGTTYYAAFRHPAYKGKVKWFKLGSDEVRAAQICQEAQSIFQDESLYRTPTSVSLSGFSSEAIAIVFGESLADSFLNTPQITATTSQEFLEKEGNVLQAIFDAGGYPESDKKVKEAAQPVYIQQIAALSRENAFLRQEREKLILEIQRLNAVTNVHCKATIKQALVRFSGWYEKRIAPDTFKTSMRYIGNFIDTLKEKHQTLLRDIKGSEIELWIEKMDGEAQTKRNRKNALSKFLKWSKVAYQLNGNPMEQTNAIDNEIKLKPIHAIEKLADLKDFFKAVKKDPYWEAWVTFAVLASPRWREQCRLKLSDINWEDNRIKIGATKTGRFRYTPIETTTLLPILKKWCAHREWQREHGQTAGEKSDYVLPSRTEGSVLWHKNSFYLHWSRCVIKCGNKAAAKLASEWLKQYVEERRIAKSEKRKVNCPRWQLDHYWGFGPREWRHTAGTVLAHSGMDSLHISRFMGNSADVAQKHYIGTLSFKGQWGFKFE